MLGLNKRQLLQHEVRITPRIFKSFTYGGGSLCVCTDVVMCWPGVGRTGKGVSGDVLAAQCSHVFVCVTCHV